MGVYIEPSPNHAISVALVLNLETGLVSPDFHTKFKDFFETVRPKTGNPMIHSLWKYLAGFLNPGSVRKKLEAASLRTEQAGLIGTPVVFPSAGNSEISISEEAEIAAELSSPYEPAKQGCDIFPAVEPLGDVTYVPIIVKPPGVRGGIIPELR